MLFVHPYNRSSHPKCFVRKLFLEMSQNSLESTCARLSFLTKLQAKACSLIKKETLAQVFSCGFCEISKNAFFTEHVWATASDIRPFFFCFFLFFNIMMNLLNIDNCSRTLAFKKFRHLNKSHPKFVNIYKKQSHRLDV